MIESPRHPRVREASKLQQRTARSETGLFLLEGPNALREGLTHGQVLEAFVTDAFVEKHADLARVLADRIVRVSDRALAAVTDTVHPQGVVAICRQQPLALDEAIAGAKLVAILHEVRDPGNLGAIIRVADAAGVDAIVVTRASVDPYNPKVQRATTGSLLHVRHAVGVATEDAVATAQRAGLQVLAADIGGTDLTSSASLARPTAWLFGNEARGLDADLLGMADAAVRLPIYGAAESLNLATAAAVCLYQSAFASRGVLGT